MSFSYFRSGSPAKQHFSQYSEDYYLDADGVLQVKDIPKDDQAIIDSYFGTRLEAILDMYSDTVESIVNGYGSKMEFDDAIVDVDTTRSDLDKMLHISQMAEDYKSANPEMSGKSLTEIVSHLKTKYNDAFKKAQKVRNDNAQEKENVQEGKQEDVHEVSQQGEQ